MLITGQVNPTWWQTVNFSSPNDTVRCGNHERGTMRQTDNAVLELHILNYFRR